MGELKPIGTQPLTQVSKETQEFILNDNLATMDAAKKTKFYLDLCHYLGINPITKPFGIYSFQGKETLYVKSDAFDQLCAKNKVSRKIMQQDVVTDKGIIKQDFVKMGDGTDAMYLVKVEASFMDGAEKVIAEDIAMVPVFEETFTWTGQGQFKKKVSNGMKVNPNSLMKAVTKGYRRAAKKLISLGDVRLEDELDGAEGSERKEFNPEAETIIGKDKGILDVALPKPYKGCKTLLEIEKVAGIEGLQEFKAEVKAADFGKTQAWLNLIEVVERYENGTC